MEEVKDGEKIRTQEIQKNIKMIDKGAIATEHLKQVYVRTKECAGQRQRELSSNESVEYAENKMVSAASFSASQSVRSIKGCPPFLRQVSKTRWSRKRRLRKGIQGDLLTGAGMDIIVGCHGVPALCHGALTSADI